MKTFKYVGCFIKNENSIQKTIKCTLKAGNLCYYAVQTLLTSRILSKNLKIKIYKRTILSVVIYGSETWSLTLRKKRRLGVFENWLRRIFGPSGKRVGSGEGTS